MLEKLGKKRFALPLVFVIMMGCVFSLMMYPMAQMEIKNLPFGIVNLDEGAVTPAGEMNAGEMIAENVTAAADEGSESAIAWNAYDSQDEMNAAFDESEIYGALVIPSDFTAKQMAFAAGMSTEAPALTAYLDTAASPMVANLMQSSLPTMMSEAGINIEVVVLNQAESASSNPLTAIMSANFIIMPIIIGSLAAGMLCAVVFAAKPGSSRKERFANVAKQIGLLIAVALVVGCVGICIANLVLGIEASTATLFCFFAIASFCVGCVTMGLANIALPLGILGLICVLSGTCCGILPPEMLPEFWQNWVYPWAPQHFFGDGLRSIIYLGEGALNDSVIPLAITACVGLICALASPLIPQMHGKNEG